MLVAAAQAGGHPSPRVGGRGGEAERALARTVPAALGAPQRG